MAELPASKNAINAAAVHIAAGDGTDADEALLRSYIEVCDGALTALTETLVSLGFEPTSRLKNRETILDKVRRDSSKVTRIRDIAGCRIVVAGTRAEQDEVVQACAENLDQIRIIDRRSDPRSGYRAVHIEAVVDERPVEIQVRTQRQHLWAELFERLGDAVGREIRYGMPIVIAARHPELDGELQHVLAQIVELMSHLSEELHEEELADQKIAILRQQFNTLESEMTTAQALDFQAQFESYAQLQIESAALDAEFRASLLQTLDQLTEIMRPTL